MFYADLHVHSRYSRATSKDADLEHMAIWAAKKGITVVGTGDFTHPEWFAEIREKLMPAEPGLFRLRDDLLPEIVRQVPDACQAAVGSIRFMLEVEISTIYKKGEKCRKVHHLIYSPDFDKAEKFNTALGKIGNLASDGRPILGLDSRDLLEITLESGDGCYLIPAHIWTPWFAAMGSKSGFDSIEDCYGDLAQHIFAVETGLSSDPAMNWRLSILDRFTLVSNSDAHSPPKLGRECSAFNTDVDYYSIRQALETGEGYHGTVEFFPEEGKYHMDGHRACSVRLSPEQTRQFDGKCPSCGKNITVGVMSRVDSLADRPEGYVPDDPMPFRNLVPLPEVISEIRGVGEKSKRVQSTYENLIKKVGSELFILDEVPIEDLRKAGTGLVAEAVERMRSGDVIRQAGYDGEYGVIRLFELRELEQKKGVSLLFDAPEPETPAPRGRDLFVAKALQREENCRPEQATRSSGSANVGQTSSLPSSLEEPTDTQAGSLRHTQSQAGSLRHEDELLAGLDADQRAAALHANGPLNIIAGPGTGKTRTLTHRVAHLVKHNGVDPKQCLTVTFSRRAAEELRERLNQLLPNCGEHVPVLTLHSLGLQILSEQASACGVASSFRVASDVERRLLIAELLDLNDRAARQALALISSARRTPDNLDAEVKLLLGEYERVMSERGLVDFDDLILKPLELLCTHADIAAEYRARWPWVSIDEFQDLDDQQYDFVQQLAVADGNVCVIGDPDQSIYGFRGANARVFERFAADYPNATQIQLRKNYRSARTILNASLQAVSPTTLVADRELAATIDGTEHVEIQTCRTDKAEAEFVVHSIEKLIGGSTFFSIDSRRVDETSDHESLSFNDFAVLYRTDSQADVLEEAFARSGMPFQRKCHQALLDDPAVQQLADFIQSNTADGLDREATADGLAVELLKRAVDEVWRTDESDDRTDTLNSLFSIAERCGDDVRRFLAELAMSVDADLWDPRADRISLLTIHASKGLEFPVVFVVGCEDGVLPLSWGGAADDLEEERRLLFVAMTRAKSRLYLSRANKRRWRGKLQSMEPSVFLNAIEEELLLRQERVARKRKPKKKPTDDNQMQLF